MYSFGKDLIGLSKNHAVASSHRCNTPIRAGGYTTLLDATQNHRPHVALTRSPCAASTTSEAWTKAGETGTTRTEPGSPAEPTAMALWAMLGRVVVRAAELRVEPHTLCVKNALHDRIHLSC